MSLSIIFLGTAAGVPTKKRGLPAILLKREGEQIMFDCGEGAQRQIMIAGENPNKNMKIFITHMHGDHVLGLPGLLQTLALLNREKKLDVYGPPKINDFMQAIKQTVQFGLTYPVEIHEIENDGVILDLDEYYVEAVWSKHAIPSLAYAYVEKTKPGKFFPTQAEALGIPKGPAWGKLQRGETVKTKDGITVKPKDVMGQPRKGRKIVYTGDTRPFKRLETFALHADVLIHESTLGRELTARAKEYGHSTPAQAAKSAKKAQVKKLILTHISQRYKNTDKLLDQARKIFKNTIIAEDFMKVEVAPLRK